MNANANAMGDALDVLDNDVVVHSTPRDWKLWYHLRLDGVRHVTFLVNFDEEDEEEEEEASTERPSETRNLVHCTHAL